MLPNVVDATITGRHIQHTYQPELTQTTLKIDFGVPTALVRGMFDLDDGVICQLESRLYRKDGKLLRTVGQRYGALSKRRT